MEAHLEQTLETSLKDAEGTPKPKEEMLKSEGVLTSHCYSGGALTSRCRSRGARRCRYWLWKEKTEMKTVEGYILCEVRAEIKRVYEENHIA